MRPATHYVVQRIFHDPSRWDATSKKFAFWTGGFDPAWGSLEDARIFSGEELDNVQEYPVLKGCDVVTRRVRLTLVARKEG